MAVRIGALLLLAAAGCATSVKDWSADQPLGSGYALLAGRIAHERLRVEAFPAQAPGEGPPASFETEEEFPSALQGVTVEEVQGRILAVDIIANLGYQNRLPHCGCWFRDGIRTQIDVVFHGKRLQDDAVTDNKTVGS